MLTSWQRAGNSFDWVEPVYTDVLLIIRVKIRKVMAAAGLDEHPDHDSEEARQLWHGLRFNPHNESVEKPEKQQLFSRAKTRNPTPRAPERGAVDAPRVVHRIFGLRADVFVGLLLERPQKLYNELSIFSTPRNMFFYSLNVPVQRQAARH